MQSLLGEMHNRQRYHVYYEVETVANMAELVQLRMLGMDDTVFAEHVSELYNLPYNALKPSDLPSLDKMLEYFGSGPAQQKDGQVKLAGKRTKKEEEKRKTKKKEKKKQKSKEKPSKESPKESESKKAKVSS